MAANFVAVRMPNGSIPILLSSSECTDGTVALAIFRAALAESGGGSLAPGVVTSVMVVGDAGCALPVLLLSVSAKTLVAVGCKSGRARDCLAARAVLHHTAGLVTDAGENPVQVDVGALFAALEGGAPCALGRRGVVFGHDAAPVPAYDGYRLHSALLALGSTTAHSEQPSAAKLPRRIRRRKQAVDFYFQGISGLLENPPSESVSPRAQVGPSQTSPGAAAKSGQGAGGFPAREQPGIVSTGTAPGESSTANVSVADDTAENAAPAEGNLVSGTNVGGLPVAATVAATDDGLGFGGQPVKSAAPSDDGFGFGANAESSSVAATVVASDDGFRFGGQLVKSAAPSDDGFGFGANAEGSPVAATVAASDDGFRLGGQPVKSAAPSDDGFGFGANAEGSSAAATVAASDDGFGFGGQPVKSAAPSDDGFGFGPASAPVLKVIAKPDDGAGALSVAEDGTGSARTTTLPMVDAPEPPVPTAAPVPSTALRLELRAAIDEELVAECTPTSTSRLQIVGTVTLSARPWPGTPGRYRLALSGLKGASVQAGAFGRPAVPRLDQAPQPDARYFECTTQPRLADGAGPDAASPFGAVVRYRLKRHPTAPLRVVCHQQPKGRSNVLLSVEVAARSSLPAPLTKVTVTVPLPPQARAPQSKPPAAYNQAGGALRWPAGAATLTIRPGEKTVLQVRLRDALPRALI